MFARKTLKCIDITQAALFKAISAAMVLQELSFLVVEFSWSMIPALQLGPPHLRCLHSCHPCQSGIMPPQVTTPWNWVSRLVYQAHLSGDKPRVLLLELGQVADVAGVLLHQAVASCSWELVSECCSWELVSECCSCNLSCWMVSFLILLLSTVPTAILHLNVHCVCDVCNVIVYCCVMLFKVV